MEEHHSLPYIDCITNTETLFNLTATSPQKSPRILHQTSQEPNELDVSDGVVNLSPFTSRLAYKDRAHRLITNIFELELDSLRHQPQAKQKSGSVSAKSSSKQAIGKKKFSIKELAYNYKKANKNVVRQLSTGNKELTNKVSRTLKQASMNRIDSYLDELQLLF